MSTITTTTITTVTTNAPQFFGNMPLPNYFHDGQDSGDIGNGNGGQGGQKNPGANGGNLPSEASSAKTIRDFQSQNNIGLLSIEQVRQMADSGYITGKDGKMTPVPPEVQMASQRMLANNAELFRKLEAAVTGKHDGLLSVADHQKSSDEGKLSNAQNPRGLSAEDYFNSLAKGTLTRPSEYGAAKSIADFQKKEGIDLLTVEQLSMIADTGYFTDKSGKRVPVSEEVQGAAKRMMDNGGELFKKLERAVTGSQDGMLSTMDFDKSLARGTVTQDAGIEPLPPYGNGNTGGANGGYGNDGANGGNYSYTVTTVTTEETDSSDAASQLPTDQSAAGTLKKFQQDQGMGLMTKDQISQMAETGTITRDGKTVKVPDEVRLAALKAMENGGALFAKLDNASGGAADGQISLQDYGNAFKTGAGEQAKPNLPPLKDAAEAVGKFHETLGKKELTLEDVQKLARGEEIKDAKGNPVAVPENVKLAAQKLLENGAEGFMKLDSGQNGDHDGKIGMKDYAAAAKKGTLEKSEPDDKTMPSDDNAAAALLAFMKDKATSGLSKDQVKQMAETGYLTQDGKTSRVPPEVQRAAEKSMENDGALFGKIEQAADGSRNGHVNIDDIDRARMSGRVGAGSPDKMSGNEAAGRIDKFLDTFGIGKKSFSLEDIQQIARGESFKTAFGGEVNIPAEVREAAHKLLQNGNEVFTELDKGQHDTADGKIGTKDYEQARNNGRFTT